jgi:hypothetical protein
MGVIRFFVAVLLVAGWTVAAMSLHVIQTAGGFQFVTKNQLSLVDTFVDARQWSRIDEERHASLYQRLRQLDKLAMLNGSADQPLVASSGTDGESVKDAWERLKSEAARRRN